MRVVVAAQTGGPDTVARVVAAAPVSSSLADERWGYPIEVRAEMRQSWRRDADSVITVIIPKDTLSLVTSFAVTTLSLVTTLRW